MWHRQQQHNHDQAPAVSQRFEAKYRINTLQAMAIRDHIWPYVEPDTHGQEYPVTSIYLDSPDLNMYYSSVTGEKNRQKLRIRTYNNGRGDDCYFEVKRRLNQIVKKERAVVRNEYVPGLLRGDLIRPEMLVNPDRDMNTLYTFCDLRETLQATPRMVVRYLREAYVGKMDEPLRITFDWQLTGLPSNAFDPTGWNASPSWLEAPGAPMVLEVKFTDTFPIWVENMIRRLNLMRDSFAKYVVCVDACRAIGIEVAGAAGDRV